jgi:archaellum component FlaF (FlaF/FlaG flagellin family)
MDKVIATILLVVASTICCVVVFNAMYPAITSSGDALVAQSSAIGDRVKSKIEIINVSDESNNVYVWVKNVGVIRIEGLERTDVFFGPDGNFQRIPYGASGSVKPYWDYAIENADIWSPAATLRITIHEDAVAPGEYYVKVVTPNGISDNSLFST